MKQKSLSIAIASVLIASGASFVVADPPFTPPGPPPWSPASPGFTQAACTTPTIDLCEWDDFGEELYAEWADILASEGNCDKYGGDVEFEIEVTYDCDNPVVSGGTFDLVVEVDLDTDLAEPFAYDCTAGTCVAMIDYADIFAHLDAAADEAADAMCAGEYTAVSYDDWKEDPYPLFSVKQMDPGKHRGPQNRTKDYEDCVSSGA